MYESGPINDDTMEDESGFMPIPYLKLTLGSFISMCLTHIPTIAIALYGLLYTFRRSKDIPKNICKAMLLMFVPYSQFISLISVLEIILMFLNLHNILEKLYSKCYPWFLPQKDDYDRDDLRLFLDVMKTIFGSCLSICLQSVLLAYSKVEDIKITQILSICFAFIAITKTTVGMLSFKKRPISAFFEDSKSVLKSIEKKLNKKKWKVDQNSITTAKKKVTRFLNRSQDSTEQYSGSLLQRIFVMGKYICTLYPNWMDRGEGGG